MKVVKILVAKHGHDQQDVKVTESRALYGCSDRKCMCAYVFLSECVDRTK